jgi:hypothetical protein
MLDKRFEYKNNQKKKISIFASGDMVIPAGTDEEILMFTLPKSSLVVRAHAVVTVGTGDAADEFDLVANETTIGSIAAETAAADTIDITPLYLPTGGEVKLVPAAALTAGASFILVVEYIETELTDGTYTD